MMDQVKDRIRELQTLMRQRNIDAYLVTTSDYHDSEYTGEHFESIKYVTGFTGSPATALVTQNWAGLWVDGRYYIQAAGELQGSGIVLMKEGMSGVPTIEEFIEQDLPNYGTLGFDGRVVSARSIERLSERLEHKHIVFAYTESLVGEIWEDRPKISDKPVWILEERYAGKSAAEKIAELRRDMEKRHADMHILTTLDDIAWLLNLRGGDVPCTPVFLAYLAVTMDDIILFINPKKIDDDVAIYLKSLGINLAPYGEIYGFATTIRRSVILLDKSRVNYTIVHSLDPSNRIIDAENPTSLRKAVKNPAEIANMKASAITDGVVMTRFICWLKKNVGKEYMTECSLASRLDAMRLEAGAMDMSFDTISAYQANAALPHYHAEEDTCAEIRPEGLYLVDSGGQYLAGTTDLTRTVALGPLTDEQKKNYTLVLKGMLDLAAARFAEGCRGESIDYLARRPLWNEGTDYNHGTGHGVGFLLSCHESPVAIRYRINPDNGPTAVFRPGIICSDEPGYYEEGNYGIRIENLLLTEKKYESASGTFLGFSFLTYVPIDTEPIDITLLTSEEKEMLNTYHAEVYRVISPYLDEEENEWLKKATLPI